MTINFVNISMNLFSLLQHLGLSERQVILYRALGETGTAAASVLARKAGIPRTTCYALLMAMHQKHFVTYYEKGNTKYFSALSGEKLLQLMERKKTEAEESVSLLKAALPLWDAGVPLALPPKVQYFEGLEGVKRIYYDTLLEDVPEKLAYSSAPEVGGELQEFLLQYIGQRRRKGMRVRAIFPENAAARSFSQNDRENLRSSRFAKLDRWKFKSEVNIYGNKVALMSLVAPFFHGVIIESAEIAETQKAIFELAWRSSHN